jgi:transcriptional regulator with XRE-family HTH domain
VALGDALYAEITAGGYTNQDDDDQAYGLTDALADLGRGRSTAELARELGVPRTTLRRWIAGATPKRDVNPIIEVARTVRRAEAVAEREDDLRAGMSGVTVTGWLTVSKDVSRRTVNAQTLQLDPHLGDRLMDAYLNGAGPAKLRQVFIAGVGEPWYRSQMRNNALNVITVDGWA